jgi:hypothetical protein
MDMKFACPGCGKHVTVDSSAGGSKVKCAGCGVEFPIPLLISQSPPPVPPPKAPRAPISPPTYDTVSIRKETSVVPVMLWGLLAFGFILVVWFVVGTVIPNFKSGREKARRQLQEQDAREQAAQRKARLAAEAIQPTQAEMDSVKIHYPDFAWKSYGTAGGDVLIITCPIDNPTPHKLVNMTLSVRCFDHTDKAVVEQTKRKLTDLGMDFAPPTQVRNHEIMVELGSVPSSSVTKVEVKIEEFQCTQMTDLDSRLTEAQDLLKKFKASDHEGMSPEHAEAFRKFNQLLEEKRKLTEP